MIGLTVPDASKNTLPPSVEYWYFVNAGFPPDESVKYTLMESVVPFTAMTFVTIGEVPGWFTVAIIFEMGEVQAEPEYVRNAIIYVEDAFMPVMTNGLAIPDPSVNETPPSVEYW